jgi:hypothetical protein
MKVRVLVSLLDPVPAGRHNISDLNLETEEVGPVPSPDPKPIIKSLVN